ncbi:hypothetical protein PLCT2_02327 [Planctomycetaceae bacterium]|nr:hypothetical protein PLCT2_02327 [Planctomycetaceae bacterium]
MPPHPQPYYAPPPYGPPQGYYPPTAPKPLSGLAVASVVCGIANPVICVGAPFFAPLGLALGGIALKQTDGSRSHRGRGLAIAGVVLNAFGLVIAGLVLFYFSTQLYTAQANESVLQAGKIDEDMYFIQERLRTYWRANGDSFGSGGPRLAGEKSRFARPAANAPKVTGTLQVSDLVVQDDLMHPLNDFSISATGPKSAVIRHAPSGRELRISNIDTRTSSVYFGR